MSVTLTLGMSGVHVAGLIHGLNRLSPTRLPRLTGETYSPLTMARVMEFQFDHRLPTDGVFGPHTAAHFHRLLSRLSHSTSGTAPRGKAVVVNLMSHPQHLTAYEDGRERVGLAGMQCHGGSTEYPSTRGVFKVYERDRHHTSTVYPIPPDNMQFAVYYNPKGGEALHFGPNYLASHGCIHLDLISASKMFEFAAGLDVIVIVVGLTPKIGRGPTDPDIAETYMKLFEQTRRFPQEKPTTLFQ